MEKEREEALGGGESLLCCHIRPVFARRFVLLGVNRKIQPCGHSDDSCRGGYEGLVAEDPCSLKEVDPNLRSGTTDYIAD